jgi:hypothetical protein
MVFFIASFVCLHVVREKSSVVASFYRLIEAERRDENRSCRARVSRELDIRSEVAAFSIIPFGRFGNNFYQICNAIACSRVLGVKTIYVPPGFMFFNRTFVTTDSIRVIPNRPCSYKDLVRSQFWYFSLDMGSCLGVSAQEVCDTFRAEFYMLFPADPSEKHILYLYVRSGDVWQPLAKNILYAPSPCSFYLDGASFSRTHDNVQIISEDKGNPCIPLLVQHGAKHIQQSLRSDISILMWAHQLMAGISSFVRAILMLSRERKILYTYNTSYRRHMPHMVCWATKEYKTRMSPWRRSADQIEAIKTVNGCRWEYAGLTGKRKLWELQ